ncbi:sulfite exporter TauE/SafE family protein [Domibacillus enclensis]|uniref:Cytochrome C biosynthesis protein n=1 Tax=Domibacillus enclensis TaxID=1017273 RepID=A0A1N6VZE8_9BACI|nr:sulfite exporter TauE/SafE family protein [Domibacillus enclensis]OXS77807.1 cytochrome C biosynthesis protein [Domibacillus enclensis]SIQ83251.1 Cytochrome c biogenesis protein CcdA [Domibacillus enclensis]
MYNLFNNFSNFVTQPFLNWFHQMDNISIGGALLLGFIGALVPCQLTANGSALMIYGNSSLRKGVVWSHIFLFLLGKIVVFSGLGLMVWLVGSQIEQTLTLFFPWFRKIIGPLLILAGFFLLGIINWKKEISFGKIPSRLFKGKTGSFLMGVSFSLGFCPTMFVLFFVTLMPLALSVPYGFVLPSVFAVGTTLPLLIIIFIVWFLEMDKVIMAKSKKIGDMIQKMTGAVLILIGMMDTIVYL